MTGPIIFAIIVIYLVLTLLLGCMFCPKSFNLYTPADIHSNTNMNWFGSIILYLLWFVFCFSLWLIFSIYYIFHIGRDTNWRD